MNKSHFRLRKKEKTQEKRCNKIKDIFPDVVRKIDFRAMKEIRTGDGV